MEYKVRYELSNKDYPHLTSAIEWCAKQFGINNFTVDYIFPSEYYYFRFRDQHNATHFGLKWA